MDKSDLLECKSLCNCSNKARRPGLTVLTGGPGAGKTAVLESVKMLLCEHVAILPEAASLIFSGGFWRLESNTARQAAQRAIYHVQTEMENLVLSEGKWCFALCDRGTIDGLAYWTGDEESYWKSFNTTKEKEFLKYESVIHLEVPELHQGYNHQNPLRKETVSEARAIDEKIHKVWRDHPGYNFIKSEDSFFKKVVATTELIKKVVPDCCSPTLECF
ncbi:MAG: ATP/GTP-binding protein [Bdellovibrionales bacterium]